MGLFTQRRVSFSFIEWEEIKQFCFACNSEVEDFFTLNKQQAVRLIISNYDFYCIQIKV